MWTNIYIREPCRYELTFHFRVTYTTNGTIVAFYKLKPSEFSLSSDQPVHLCNISLQERHYLVIIYQVSDMDCCYWLEKLSSSRLSRWWHNCGHWASVSSRIQLGSTPFLSFESFTMSSLFFWIKESFCVWDGTIVTHLYLKRTDC